MVVEETLDEELVVVGPQAGSSGSLENFKHKTCFKLSKSLVLSNEIKKSFLTTREKKKLIGHDRMKE